MCFDLNTGFARLINSHSVLFGNVARLNLQFDGFGGLCGVRSAECGVRSMENAECGK